MLAGSAVGRGRRVALALLLGLGGLALIGAGDPAAPHCDQPAPATVRTDSPGPLYAGALCDDWTTPMDLVVEVPPAHGTLSWLASNHETVYRPDAGYQGEDSYSYHVTNEHGASNSVTQHVTVDPAYNQPPYCWTAEDAARTGHAYPVGYPCSDPDGDALQPTVTDPPAHGSVTLSGTEPTYTAPTDFTGNDRIGLSYDDGHGGVAQGAVDFQVTQERPPVCSDWLGTPFAGRTNPLPPPAWGCNDDEGDPLTVSLASQPAHGTVSVAPDGTWQIDEPKYVAGHDAFTVVVSDGYGGQVTRTMGLMVYDLDPLPDFGPACQSLHTTVRAGESVSVPLVCPEHLRYETSLEIVSPPAADRGVLGEIDQQAGTVAFTARKGAVGTATFAYREIDNAGGHLEPGTVSIEILPPPSAFAAAPARSQHLARVLASGLAVDVTIGRRAKVALHAVLSRADARRMGLARRPVEVAHALRTLSPGRTRLHLLVTAKARRALRRARTAKLTLATAATDTAGNRRTLPARVIRLRRG